MAASADLGFVPDAPTADTGFTPDQPADVGFLPDGPSMDDAIKLANTPPPAGTPGMADVVRNLTAQLNPGAAVPDMSDVALRERMGQEQFEEMKRENPFAVLGGGLNREGRMITGGLADVGTTVTGQTPPGESKVRNLAAAVTDQQMPFEQEEKNLSTPLRIAAAADKGVIQTVPQIAATVVAPEAAPIIWGSTPEGFDPKQAVLATVLPIVGKYTGAITEAIAVKAGISSDAAKAALNKLGGAAGAASLIGADQAAEIYALPPEQRKDAIIDAIGNTASMFLLGATGERHQFGKVSPEADAAAVAASLPKGFVPKQAFINPQETTLPRAPTPAEINPRAVSPAEPQAADVGFVPDETPPLQTQPEVENVAPAPNTGEVLPPETPIPAKSGVEDVVDLIQKNTPATPKTTVFDESDTTPATVADLAKLEAIIRGNQIKPREPSEPQPPTPAEETPTPQPEQATAAPAAPVDSNVVGDPAGKNMPTWVKEEMLARGLDPKRPLNDLDIKNPSVVEAIKADPTLTDEQKAQILKTGSPKAPLTPELESAKTDAGAGPETITGQNEQKGSDATAATSLVAEQMPAEREKVAPPQRRSKPSFFIRPRSDGEFDILDAIQDVGGLRPPGKYSGGEYDGFREAMKGPARLLVKRGAKHAPDTILAEIHSMHGFERIQSPDDLFSAVATAVKQREALRGRNNEQDLDGRREAQFQQKVLDNRRPKTEQKNVVAYKANDLLEGDTFDVQGHKFEVEHLEFDDSNHLAYVQVKDGPKFGVRQVGADDILHVDKGSFEAGAGHSEGVPQPVESDESTAGYRHLQNVVSLDDYLGQHGARNAPSFPEYHRTPGGVTKPGAKAASQRVSAALTEYAQHREQLVREYEAKINAGELRAPTRRESLEETAKGQGEPAQAAKRLLAKMSLSDKSNALAEKPAQPFKVGDKVLHQGEVKTVTKSVPGSEFVGVGKRAVNVKELKLASLKDKAEAVANKLEKLKSGLKGGKGGQLHAFGIAADLWDRAVSIAQGIIRAGGNIGAAIDAAIKHIRANHTGEFDEPAARAKLNESIRDEAMELSAPQSDRWQDLAAKVTEAAEAGKKAIADVANRPDGVSKEEAIKAKNIATATLRNLRDRLLKSPDYADHLLTEERETHRQLSALAQKAGIERVRPDGLYGYEDKLKAALTPAEFEQLQDLDNHWQQIRSEIDNLPKKHITAAYNRLYPEEAKGGTGPASLDIPSDWMRSRIGEKSPVQDAQDITTAADRVKQSINDLPNHLRDFYRDAQDFTRRARNKISTLEGRDIISYGKDAAENKANILSRQASNAILHELNRSFGQPLETRNPIRENALSLVIEAGNPESLRQMRETILQSQFAKSKWARQALAAIDYGEKHWDRFEPVAELYGKVTDAQVAAENAGGIKTLHRSGGYVFHLHDVLENWAHLEEGSGGAGAASPFKHIRDFATYADSIANGMNPKTLNAVDLLQRRVSLGQKLINYRNWQDSLMRVVDPKSEQPLVAPAVVRIRADGSQDTVAPAGYNLINFAGQTMAVHRAYAPLFKALTGESAFRQGGWNYLMKGVTTAKHGMLLFDTFHLGRLAFWNAMARGGLLPGNPTAFKKGITLLDNSDADIRRMVETGDLTHQDAEALVAQRKTLNLLLDHGLNIGGIGDNIYSDWVQHLPVAGSFNKWLFEKYQRGAMAEVGLMEFQRQKAAHPEMADGLIAREAAKAINTRFGNLNAQSWIKSKTMGDLVRIFGLAPQWNESLIRAEIGAVRDAGVLVKGLPQGKVHLGLLGRAVSSALIGQFIANQLINYYTRGTPTWENPEEGFPAKISAWVPDYLGHSDGFFLNPMTLPMEITHLILKGYERTGRLDLSVRDALRSRESSVGRFADVMASGSDSEGNVAHTTSERLALAARAATPLPISGSAIYRFGKEKVTGQPEEKYPGQFQRQAMQTVGVKPDAAPSAEQRIRSLAMDWMRNNPDPRIRARAQAFDDNKFHSDYFPLDNAIRVGNLEQAKKELGNLLATKKPQTILTRYAERTQGRFTGSGPQDALFQQTLTPEQQRQYEKAIEERRKIANTVRDLMQRQ